MNKVNLEMMVRVFILDSLVANSGKKLVPELIGDITKEIHERIVELLRRDYPFEDASND